MSKLLTLYSIDLRFKVINGSDDGEFPPDKTFSQEYLANVAVRGDVVVAIAEAKRRVEAKYAIDNSDALALGLEKVEGSRAVEFEVRSVSTIGAETI